MSIIEFILWGTVLLSCLALSITFLSGKGAFLLAGYNTMSKREKAKYDEKAVCRCMGKFTLAMTFVLMLCPIGIHTGMLWMQFLVIPFTVIATPCLLIYANTGGRFLKKGDVILPEETESEKEARKAEEKKLEKHTLIMMGFVAFGILAIHIAILIIAVVFVFAQR